MVTINVDGTQMPIEVSKSGTGNSNNTTNGIVTFNTPNLRVSGSATIDSSGYYTNTKQPTSVGLSAIVNNVTGAGTTYTILGGGGEPIDKGSNYNTGTGTFTAPTAGIYRISSAVTTSGGSTETGIDMNIVTTQYTYFATWRNYNGGTSGKQTINHAILAIMAANDTAYTTVKVFSDATDTSDIVKGNYQTCMSVVKVC